MGNQVLTFFFFFFGGHHVKVLLADMVASKKKGQHTVFHGLCCTTAIGLYFCNFFRSCSKFFSALEIKDNSKFNKGQGRGVQIKDCPLK